MYFEFHKVARKLQNTPAEVVGMQIAFSPIGAIIDALGQAFDTAEEFEQAYDQDSCSAIDRLEAFLD